MYFAFFKENQPYAEIKASLCSFSYFVMYTLFANKIFTWPIKMYIKYIIHTHTHTWSLVQKKKCYLHFLCCVFVGVGIQSVSHAFNAIDDHIGTIIVIFCYQMFYL